jgi:hypothetical protein
MRVPEKLFNYKWTSHIPRMFHWGPRRIEAHVKICVLALLIERVAEMRCGEPWSRIRHGLEQLQISHFLTKEYSFYRGNEISAKARNILKQLNIPVPKLIDGLEKAPKSVDTRHF